jgi:hypothetical protein
VFAQVSDASSKTCRCADLPKVLLAFEKRRDIVLLSDDEKASLEAFAESVRLGIDWTEPRLPIAD